MHGNSNIKLTDKLIQLILLRIISMYDWIQPALQEFRHEFSNPLMLLAFFFCSWVWNLRRIGHLSLFQRRNVHNI